MYNTVYRLTDVVITGLVLLVLPLLLSLLLFNNGYWEEDPSEEVNFNFSTELSRSRRSFSWKNEVSEPSSPHPCTPNVLTYWSDLCDLITSRVPELAK